MNFRCVIQFVSQLSAESTEGPRPRVVRRRMPTIDDRQRGPSLPENATYIVKQLHLVVVVQVRIDNAS